MDSKTDDIIKRRSKLSPAKQAILEKRLQGESEPDIQQIVIPRRTQKSPIPLSAPQQRLWFLQQLEPQSSIYNEFACIQLKGVLNCAALEKSFNEIVKRHESLRTSFETLDDQPVQVIHPTLSVELQVVNLSNLPQALQEAEVEQLSAEIARKPFDLAFSPLLRVMLLQTSEQENLLLLVVHHIVCDGWSIQVLNQELAVLYEAFSAGKSSPLLELSIQYPDYSIWQHQWLQGEREKTQLSYWKQQLADAPTTLSLPIDRQRPPVQSFKGAARFFKLSSHLSDMVRSLSRQQGVTLFMTLLAVFQAQLYCYTSQEDICIGSPVANRNHTGIEGLIGFFVNTLVFRTDLSGNPSFLELLGRVREVCIGAYTHADLPFERLVEELHPERNLSHTPLFQVTFALQEDTKKDLVLPNLTLKWLHNNSETAKFDLTLYVVDSKPELWGWWEYNTDLFDAGTIERMVGHFTNLLEGIVTQPENRLSELPLLTEPERQTLLVDWNDTTTDFPQDKCIHELFEAQVARTPDAVAVVFEDQQLSYRELNQRANQLAHYLQKQGVKPEVLVGICVERSLDIVIGLLAILKAGGAYIPLDPSYPQERLAFILENAQISVLLTQTSLAEAIPQQKSQVVCLDAHWYYIAQQSKENLFSEVTPDNLAYVIYTSGSTGRPKGVMIKHASTVAMLDWANKTSEIEAKKGVLASTSICFDLSVFEIFVPLCCGGKVILIENALYLPTLSTSENVTLINTVPSVISQLLKNGCIPTSVKTVNIAGEPLYNQLVQELYRQENIQQVFNLYGPSEDTTYSTSAWIQKGSSNTPSIGRPIHNTQIYLLDKNCQPVPVGVPGMLYLGGAGLARGYLNKPELTANKFIPNPYTNQPGERLYKTGDQARYLPNGEIEYIGRIDYQVKVRGFRIELGEIEALIHQYPAVKETVVVVSEDSGDSKRLVAYVVPQTEQTLTISKLRDFLESKLPSYMIPGTFIILEALPLTPNGKLDRKALPIPELTQILSSNIILPTTPIENLLAGIWAKILGIEKVGIDNNFFELGGHSLIATRVMSQIRQVFQIELPLRCLFEKPTIAELAKEIETTNKAGLGIETTKIEPIVRSPQLPLSFAQQRLWFLAQLEPDSSFYNIPAAVRLKGELNIKALQQSFNEILRRHEALRTNFQTVEGQAIAVISEVKPLRLPTIDISELPLAQQEVEIRQQAAQEAQQPFDISSDYLLRVKLLRLDEQEHIVLLTMHHIASDGWSVGVLVQELATLYPAFCNQQLSPLTELPIQYIDFAAWQRQWLRVEVLETQISYWQKQLENTPKVLELPTDYSRPAIQTFRGATYSFELSDELSVALNKLSQQQGSTLFMTLLAAFQTLLWRYTGQEDIVVGSPIANRNRAEIEGLIGFFVNTLVLRTNLAGNPSFEELLKKVREVTLGAYTHQDLPFELLVEQLQPQRDLSHTPLFQVMFVLQNAPMSALELPGLTLSPVESDSHSAKFDLTLYISETESGLVGNLEYNTDLFAETSIQRMAAHLQMLLSGIVTNPQQRLSELPLLTQTEKHQLLQEWNDTEVEYPQQLCIHELFEAQVQKTPDAVAVVFEDEQLTYWELNTIANQLAHYLQQLGVKPEVLVGICVERSLYMIIGLLAILKAGGAYVPLDPSYPKKRLAYMLEDSRPGLLLTQQHLVENLPTNQAQVICIDSDWQLIADENRENPGCNITVDNLAYVIYTSGSTGKPKGAINTHQGICNRLLWMQDAYQLTAADCVLHKTPFSFDVSVWEFFWTLMTGARLVVAQPEGHRDPSYIVNLILQQQITTLHFVPSMLQAFLSAEGLEKCQSLVRVIASGEALPVQLQQSFFNRLDAQLYNLYGPTEAAVDVTFWQCQDNITNQTTVPIGRPIANIQIYLLDKYFNPVAFGVAGEVYIGGVGVGRGYLNRPDLTAEKFIPNPFSDKAAGRLYKTGDLARYLPTGEIEYIGRIDHQVKIRGFRIELGEIEALITKHPAVRETVVAVYCSQADSQQIVAYIVPQKEQTLVIPKLRSFLESKLPNYMIPATFATLEALPLTPNGKVDRKALPAPDTARPELEKAFIAPQTTAEKQLAVIWTQVLDLEKVGINDNFFELGGDSILILQIVSKANLAGLHLTPKQLFQHQTIAKLAAVAGTTQKISAQQNLITGSLELTPIEHWFFEQEQPEPHHWNQAVMLEVKQRINPVALEKVAEDLQKHHDALRSRFIKKELGLQAIIVSPDNVIPTTYLDLSALPKDQQVAQMEIMSDQLQASLNLTQGPLFRVAIFDLDANQPSRLLWVIHHLVVDGVSWRILIEDFQTAYEQICQNKALQLPPKTTSLQQWSSYLQEYAQSSALRSELEYWLTIEQQPVKPIPIDFSYENNLEESACTLTVSLTAEETQVLLQHVPAVYQTQINDVLLTALVQTFSQWTGETSLLIDLEGHGREELFEDIDLSRTVGWFTTIFPVHLSLNSAFDSPGKALKSIKEQLRAIPNRGIGYGVLRYLSEDMEISQRFSRLPKAEVVFNYLGQFDQVLPQSSLFGFATESTGPSNSLQSKRNHLLEVNGGISQGRLQINWTYSNQLHSQTTVETLAQSFIEALRVLITHCQSPDAGGFTPSDFAEFQQSQWEQSDLDAITAVIGNI